jgi:hypothetical protein
MSTAWPNLWLSRRRGTCSHLGQPRRYPGRRMIQQHLVYLYSPWVLSSGATNWQAWAYNTEASATSTCPSSILLPLSATVRGNKPHGSIKPPTISATNAMPQPSSTSLPPGNGPKPKSQHTIQKLRHGHRNDPYFDEHGNPVPTFPQRKPYVILSRPLRNERLPGPYGDAMIGIAREVAISGGWDEAEITYI